MVCHEANQIGWEKVHRIHQHDPDEDSERSRRYEAIAVAVVKDALDLVVDEINEKEFDKRLALARYACRCSADHPPKESQSNDPEHDRRQHGIDVDRPEAAMRIAERLGEEAQVMLDIFGRREFGAGSHLSGHQ